jgi:nucleoside-diphosphate-sugar epimerase
MKILITGGLGFLGSQLIIDLLNDGYKIIALHRRTNFSELLIHPNLTWVNFDFLQDQFKILEIDAVLHLATVYGKNEKSSVIIDSNIVLPIKILELAIKNNCKLFINTDSYFSKEQFKYKHMQTYVKSKFDFLNWAKILVNNCDKIKFVNFRIEHVYGPNDNFDKFVPFIMKKLAINENIYLTKGEQCRDFIFIKDVIDAYKTLLNSFIKVPESFIEVEVGTGILTSIYNFVVLAKEIMGSKSSLYFGALEYREDEIMSSIANNSSLISLGWKSNYTLKQGLKLTIFEDLKLK